MKRATFLAELGRRRVPRFLVIYMAAVFAAAQGVELLINALHLPELLLTIFVIAGIAGLPAAAAAAWIYDFTPAGLVRTPHSDVAQPFEWRPAHIAVTLIVLFVLLGAGWIVLRPQPAAGGRVAVMPLENRTGQAQYDALGGIAADWIIEGLVRAGFVEVVDIQAALVTAAAGATPTPPSDGTVVQGWYYLQDDDLLFQLRLSRADGTLLEALPPIRAAAERSTDAIEEVRSRVLSALAGRFDPRLARFEGDGAAPPSYEAYEAYVEGLHAYLRADWTAAAERFHAAGRADTAFHRAALWSAISNSLAGDVERADSTWVRLRARESQLSVYDRHHARFFATYLRGDLEEAYQEARRMLAAAPGSTQAKRELALSALRTWRLEEALRHFDGLDPDHGLTREWPEYWYWKALTLELLDRPQQALAVAREGRKRHATPRTAHAEAMILATLGDVEAAAAIARGEGVPRDHSDLGLLPALALRISAARHPDLARQLLLDGVADARRLEGSSYAALYLYYAGALDAAYAELAGVSDARRGADALHSLAGAIAAQRGDTAAARAHLAALAELPASRFSSTAQARIRALLGEADEAARLLGRASLVNAGGAIPIRLEPAFASLRGHPLFERNMQPFR